MVNHSIITRPLNPCRWSERSCALPDPTPFFHIRTTKKLKKSHQADKTAEKNMLITEETKTFRSR
jgi:hypothetical protein